MRPRPADEILPVPAGDAAWDGEGVAFLAGERSVDVRGDVAQLQAVLAACDGRSSVAAIAERHGAEAAELVRGLLDAGALIDVERAWRRGHALGDNPSLAGHALGEGEEAELVGTTFGPRPGHGPPVPLAPGDSRVLEVARARTSGRVGSEARPATWEGLSTLLAAAYGRTSGRWLTVPSGGALYGMVVHLLLRAPLGPLEPGIWWYDPWRAEVRLQRAGPPAVEPLMVSHPVTDPLLGRGEPLVAVSSDMRRVARKYAARGYRLALMEAGAVMQTAYLLGGEIGLPVRACAGWEDAGLAALLELPEDVVPQLLLFAGT